MGSASLLPGFFLKFTVGFIWFSFWWNFLLAFLASLIALRFCTTGVFLQLLMIIWWLHFSSSQQIHSKGILALLFAILQILSIAFHNTSLVEFPFLFDGLLEWILRLESVAYSEVSSVICNAHRQLRHLPRAGSCCTEPVGWWCSPGAAAGNGAELHMEWQWPPTHPGHSFPAFTRWDSF